MREVFSLESTFSRVMSKVADLAILNILFIVSCLPIFTIGAALSGMSYSVNRMIAKDQTSLFRIYLKGFKDNFKKSTLMLLIISALALVLRAWYLVGQLYLSGTGKLVLIVLIGVLSFRLSIMSIWCFSLQGKFENPIKVTMKNAYLMSFRHFLTTIMVLLLMILAVTVTYLYPMLTGFGMFWFFLGFSSIGYLNGLLFHKVFLKYIPD